MPFEPADTVWLLTRLALSTLRADITETQRQRTQA